MSSRKGDSPKPQRGDVDSVDYADPATPDTRIGPLGRIPEPRERVAVRLVGHPFTYVVRVQTAKDSGPRITELTITAGDGGAVDYEAVRAVPVRRLAYTAAQWIARKGGQVWFFGETVEAWTQPDVAAPPVYQAAKIAEEALALGLPVRPTVAARLNVSKTTVDRLLKRAKAEGWFDDKPLPKRPQPPQRDIEITKETNRR
ncbi:hypothetical protein Mkiyose1088_41440 [Mycobacterium kiyosense]|uniref:hypothetical protein n=1 Tax=Mycobacterium TaxID=1763 RepID=UPI001EF09041|nr:MULTISPECIES: hypothetical protein [Mycobacterium]BDB41976.1 hypothetical protein IWGMT90018_24220 [Mycobacterium kiyosense]BDE14741.1 hypothetical protein MKCMC460_36010 [Mycobacterium sp. 20KCMC460]GLC03587.1 hypothetical protein SRL2020400_41780 [Mycobacterium kiyosense]GLD02278.1 hypothetical protein Mkiyose1088_41440 [Mycobacterium kiyosense]GLD07259.1 hypothetical protein Mkiyose1383_35850 [Mycobacterium kiyosense]